jgi:ArsR family transcriptional regulator
MARSLQEFKAELFRVLAHPVRIRILESLRAAGSLTVGEIQSRVGVEASNVSQHLGVLRQHDLVLTRRDGTSVWYSVANPQLFGLLDGARAIFENQLRAQTRMLDEAPGKASHPRRSKAR